MAAYVIVNVEVLDAERYERYRALAPDSIRQYGGRYLARGGETAVLEGDVDLARVVVLEFASLERVRAWWDSPEYAEAKALRQAVARSTVFVVEGLAEPL